MAKSCFANVIEIIDSDDEPDVSHNVGAFTTTIGAKSSSVNVIDIIDSDEERDVSQNVPLDRQDSGNISVATSFAEEKENNLDNNPNDLQDMQGSGNISPATCFEEEKGKNLDINHAGNNEENLDVCEDILFTSNSKRKRACNVVMSESESDRDDDNMRNSLTTANLEADKVTDDIQMPRRRLKTLRKIRSKNRGHKTYQQSIPTNGELELEEDLSYSEEGRRVARGVDVSDCEDFSNKSRDESNSDAESNSSSLQDLQDNNKDSYLQNASDRECSVNISLTTCSADDADDDADVDDDMPISQVIRMKKPRRRCLKSLRKCVSKSHGDKVSYQQSIPTNDDAHDGDDVSTEDLSQSEEGNASSKSQDGCNGDVDSVDLNNSEDLQDHSKDSNLQDVSDDDFDKLLSKIQRKKKQKIKWESEAEMCAELGKDPVLCMKAVCVLYRQQTGEEQNIKGTVCRNGRGFSTHHAYRGSKLAEFLLDGSPDGGINKTVEELKKFDPEGVEVCEELAFHYSAQLFEIFQNKEDAFFP